MTLLMVRARTTFLVIKSTRNVIYLPVRGCFALVTISTSKPDKKPCHFGNDAASSETMLHDQQDGGTSEFWSGEPTLNPTVQTTELHDHICVKPTLQARVRFTGG